MKISRDIPGGTFVAALQYNFLPVAVYRHLTGKNGKKCPVFVCNDITLISLPLCVRCIGLSQKENPTSLFKTQTPYFTESK